MLRPQPDVRPRHGVLGAADRDRPAVGAGHEAVVEPADGLTAQHAGRVGAAPAREAVERVLRGHDLARGHERHGGRVLQRGIEHHRADAVGMALGVDRADLRAGGDAEIVELRDADRSADGLHVLGDARGVDVADERPRLAQAALPEHTVVTHHPLELRPAAREEPVAARHRGRPAADRAVAARVDADEVEAREHGRREDVAGLGDVAHRPVARAAGMEEERAEPPAGWSARRRSKRTVIFGPSGCAQSTGTWIELHSIAVGDPGTGPGERGLPARQRGGRPARVRRLGASRRTRRGDRREADGEGDRGNAAPGAARLTRPRSCARRRTAARCRRCPDSRRRR